MMDGGWLQENLTVEGRTMGRPTELIDSFDFKFSGCINNNYY